MTVLFADHAIERFGEILESLGARNVFLVADRIAYEQSGAAELLRDQWKDVRHTAFHDFQPNPQLSDVEQALRHFSRETHDVVVAMGGGTALDLGKLTAVLAMQAASAGDVIRGKAAITRHAVPLVAIPTTAGTGSEATQFAVVYIDGEKHSLSHPYLVPKHAIIDPQLTASLPPSVAAASGLDCFCQAIESIWSVRATDASIGKAAAALELARDHLIEAVLRPTDLHRYRMCQAAHLAGEAINVSHTTAAHALSYALTSDYGVPHGTAVAITLASLLVWNDEVTAADCVDIRGPAVVRQRIAHIIRLLQCQDAKQAGERINWFVRSVDSPTRLRDLSIPQSALPSLARRVNVDRLANNPRRLRDEDLALLLERCW